MRREGRAVSTAGPDATRRERWSASRAADGRGASGRRATPVGPEPSPRPKGRRGRLGAILAGRRVEGGGGGGQRAARPRRTRCGAANARVRVKARPQWCVDADAGQPPRPGVRRGRSSVWLRRGRARPGKRGRAGGGAEGPHRAERRGLSWSQRQRGWPQSLTGRRFVST